MTDRAAMKSRLNELAKRCVDAAVKRDTDYVARAIWVGLGLEEDYDAISDNSILKDVYRNVAKAAIVAVYEKMHEREDNFLEAAHDRPAQRSGYVGYNPDNRW